MRWCVTTQLIWPEDKYRIDEPVSTIDIGGTLMTTPGCNAQWSARSVLAQFSGGKTGKTAPTRVCEPAYLF